MSIKILRREVGTHLYCVRRYRHKDNLLRHKNIRTCFFLCRVVYFSSSARRDRGGGHSPEGLKSCVSKPTPTHCVDSPYIFRSENTEGEKITVRDMKIAPTEIFCGAMFAFKGFRLYSTTLAVAPLLRRAIYTPAGSVVVSMLTVVAPCCTACVATTRPVVS